MQSCINTPSGPVFVSSFLTSDTQASILGAFIWVQPATIGAAAIAQAGDSVSATGVSEVSGTAGTQDAADAATGSAEAPIAGAGDAQDAADVVTGAGLLAAVGAGDEQEAPDTAAGAGEVFDTPEDVLGVLSSSMVGIGIGPSL